MEAFFEVLKYTIPGLVVFATAYFSIREFLEDRRVADRYALKVESQKILLPVRLQAYERLTLLCDRALIPNVLLRIRVPGMTVTELRASLLLAIRQEFEHNTSQQVYVSATLWQILSVAKDETLARVSLASEELDPREPDQALVDRLLAAFDEPGYIDPLTRAMVAVRTEAGQLF